MERGKNSRNERSEDHSDELSRIRKIVGQLGGVEKMISERRYCRDIIQQTRAISSAIKALELAIVKKSFTTSMRQSAKSGSEAAFERKLKELLELIGS